MTTRPHGGARATAGIAGALMFHDQRDLSMFGGVLRDVIDGAVRQLVFVLPEGRSYPVPLYELALLCAGMIADHGRPRRWPAPRLTRRSIRR